DVVGIGVGVGSGVAGRNDYAAHRGGVVYRALNVGKLIGKTHGPNAAAGGQAAAVESIDVLIGRTGGGSGERLRVNIRFVHRICASHRSRHAGRNRELLGSGNGFGSGGVHHAGIVSLGRDLGINV